MTKREELFLYWLTMMITHCSEYAIAYGQRGREKYEASDKLLKKNPGLVNVSRFLNVVSMAHKIRAQDYHQWVAALEAAKGAFEAFLVIKEKDIPKRRKVLKTFLKENKPREIDIKIGGRLKRTIKRQGVKKWQSRETES